jgi:putative peptidoglycan lipid II flippase
VTRVLAAYAIGLLAYGAVRLLATAFYAFQDTRTPVRVAVAALAVNVGLGITLAWLVGTPGIALATAVAAIVNATLLGALLRRRVGRLFSGSAGADVGRMAGAAALAGALGVLPYRWILARWPEWELAARLAGTVGLYGGIALAYWIAARALGVDETQRLWERIRRRRGRSA